jgi:hypothetical protein
MSFKAPKVSHSTCITRSPAQGTPQTLAVSILVPLQNVAPQCQCHCSIPLQKLLHPILTHSRNPPPFDTSQMPSFCRLPTELNIAIATYLDPRSLVCFKSVRSGFFSLFSHWLALLILPYQTCRVFRDIVSRTPPLRYALALAERGLCDGPPSPVTVVNRLELVEAYEEAWRTFSWSKHLTLELPFPHEAPYVTGGTLVQPIYEIGGILRSFVVQSIPSPLRGVPERRWQIDFDFVVVCFVIDATQDLLVVVPSHDTATFVFSFFLS